MHNITTPSENAKAIVDAFIHQNIFEPHRAKQIKVIIDDKSRYVDWATRTDRKAELKMDIVITLAKNKYPPFTKDEVFKEILEQAENFKKNRLVDGYQVGEPVYRVAAEPDGPKYGKNNNS